MVEKGESVANSESVKRKPRKEAERLDFTIKEIKALAPPKAGRRELKDTKAPGLYLRVTPAGVKTFSYVGRAKGSSRVERLTLGKFPAVKPEEARRRATELAGEMAGGKSAASAARERRGELTVGQLKELYLEHLRAHTRSPHIFETLYGLYIEPHFSNRRLSEIKSGDVTRWLRGMPEEILKRRAAEEAERRAKQEQRRREVLARHAKAGRRYGPDPKPKRTPLSAGRVTGKTTANRAYDALRAMFNWAMSPDGGHVFAGPNPAAGQTKYAMLERERFLQPDELGPFFDALGAETNLPVRDCALIKLLTGVRRRTCHEMRWSDVNLTRAEWRIGMTKNGKPQTVALVPEAVAILTEREKMEERSPWVFPSAKSKTGHIVNTAKAWRRILARAGLTDLREHDLRRTLGSWQARDGASLVLIGRSLNHLDPSSTKIYARLDMDPVRQSLSRATTSMFQAAGLKPSAEVIELKEAASKRSADKQASRK